MLQTESTAWVCSVPVATVWTAPEKAHPIDAEGIAENPNINKWLQEMSREDNKDLTDSNRIQTQLLYGEPVLSDEVVDGWAKIIARWQPCQKDERGYPGWMPMSQLKANGVIISRDAVDQALEGIEIDQYDQDSWHIGDLLFFAYEEGKGRLHHVGIYYGNDLMLHSPTPGKAIEIIELAGTKHETELCAVRRFVKMED